MRRASTHRSLAAGAALTASALALSGCAMLFPSGPISNPAADREACEKWAEEYSEFNEAVDQISDDEWYGPVGSNFMADIAEKEAESAALADDPDVKAALQGLSESDFAAADALAQGLDPEVGFMTDEDVYLACLNLDIQTEPRYGDGSLADFVTEPTGSTEPTDSTQSTKSTGLSDAGNA